eukprot:s1324_g7.t1
MASRPAVHTSAIRADDGPQGQAPKRCPWETSGNKQGIELADRTELAIADGSSIMALHQISCDTLHPGAQGITFLTMQSMKRNMKLSTHDPCVGIIKGFQKQQLVKAGVDKDRMQQVVAVLRDTTTLVVEPRAITLVNFADDPTQYVFKDETACDIKLPDQPMVNIIFEIRQKSTSVEFWRAFADSRSFSKYTLQVIEKADKENEAVFYPTVCKDDYVFRRAVIPSSIRDIVYAQSGFKGITVKAIRQTDQHMEDGLEIIRLPDEKRPLHALWLDGHETPGWLGVFNTALATFVRVADSKIDEARKHWIPDDPRWNSRNRGLKLSLFFKVQGFTPGINIPDATRILEEVGWTIVVLRTFQSAELTTLIVGADKEPPQTRLVSNLGTIMISPVDTKNRSTLAKKSFKTDVVSRNVVTKKQQEDKSTASSSTPSSSTTMSDPWASAAAARTSSRVDALEKRMTALSAQVDKVEKAHGDQLTLLKDSQDRGFQQLLEAICQLKGGVSTSSTPVASPAAKIQKLSS